MTKESKILIGDGILYLLGHGKRLMPIFIMNGSKTSKELKKYV